MTAAVELWDAQQKIIIKEQIARDCSDGELRLFAQVCAKNGLDPFTRQIYAIKRGGKMTIQTSIDGFRVVAERSGRYEGQTPKQWCGQDGVWVDVWLKSEPPAAARVGVWKQGFREALYAVATWGEYGQDSPMWKKMGPHMLAKCAESLALRAAFPNDLTGLYTEDEYPIEQDRRSVPAPDPESYDRRRRTVVEHDVEVDTTTGEIIDVAPQPTPPVKARTVAAPKPKAEKSTIVEAAQQVKAVDRIGAERFDAMKARKDALDDTAKEMFKGDLAALGMSGFTKDSSKADADQVELLLKSAEDDMAWRASAAEATT